MLKTKIPFPQQSIRVPTRIFHPLWTHPLETLSDNSCTALPGPVANVMN